MLRLLLVAYALALGSSRAPVTTPTLSRPHNYAGGGIFAGSGVAAAGVNRGVTSDRWAGGFLLDAGVDGGAASDASAE